MKVQRIVAAVAAASLVLSTGGAFAQAEQNQVLMDQAQRANRTGQPLAGMGDSPNGYRNNDRGQARTDQRGQADQRGQYRGDQRQQADQRQYRGDPRTQYRNDNRGYDNRGYDNRGYGDARGYGRGAGPDHSFYRGGRLPSEYRSRQYVVDDWRGHHLSAPPRGYHWVQAGGDYVLVAIASGIIASILLNQ